MTDPNILYLEKKLAGSRAFHHFREYGALADTVLNGALPPPCFDASGSRIKAPCTSEDGLSYLVVLERDRDDPRRPKRDRYLNYSLKEVLIARALSELAEFSDDRGCVRFARPIGYLAEGDRRYSLFLYEKALEQPLRGTEFLSRAFAYFVMIYNGILHKEGPKDFIPIRKDDKDTLFVVDFEHCEIVPRHRIDLVVDVTLYNLSRIEILDRNSLESGFKEVFAVPPGERRRRLFDELVNVSSELADRVRPFLEERAYFTDGTRTVGDAYDPIMKAAALLGR